jgi:hypothetical protein
MRKFRKNHFRARRKYIPSRKSCLSNPRNPQQQSITGHAKDHRAKRKHNAYHLLHVYNTTVINNTTVNRVSYNGGNGGITARLRPEEQAAAHERHIPPVAVQTQHAQAARANPELRASVNHGTPSVAATPKPGAFNDRAVVPAKQA